MRRKRCRCCHELYLPDSRGYRQQKTCSKPGCRAWRKRQAVKAWKLKNPIYALSDPVKQKKWRKEHKGYWKKRRSKHSGYVMRNRKAQRLRNAGNRCVIAKGNGIDGVYISIFRPETNEHTQFTRALASVEVAVKFTAKSHPEAKGKIEKRFDYFQRRLPFFCERYRITNLTKANEMLKEAIYDYDNIHIHDETKEIPEKRWQRAMQEGR